MSYCINPNCTQRENSDAEDCCQACRAKLLIFDRYRLIQPLRPLSDSFVTEIFEVEDTQEGGVKVLKVLKLNDKSLLRLFEQEKKILTDLEHPGIPKAEKDAYFKHYLSNSQKLHCLVMQKIEGISLDKWIQHNSAISEAKAIAWLKQITTILDEVHRQKFSHRDLKPSNIMLKPDGQLVLIDFGTAREITQTFIEGRNVTIISSYGYTAPEQKEGRGVPQSDFFALGRTFVHLLTGKPPQELMNQTTNELIWRDKAPEISTDLKNLIDDLMKLVPKDRPQDTQQILQRIEKMKRNTVIQETETSSPKNRWLVPVGLVTSSLVSSMIGAAIGIRITQSTPKESIDTYVTVNANAGFQNSHIFVKKGQKVTLEPEGHIHIASEQLKNFVNAIRPLIALGLAEGELSSDELRRYKEKGYEFNENNKFPRTWSGPKGQDFTSETLQECRLKLDQPWGSLMAIVIPSDKNKVDNFSDLSDPFKVLGDNGLKLNQLISVPDKKELPPFDKDGWLTFIVNEAVISKESLASDTSKKFYRAIEKSVGTNKIFTDTHRVDYQALPLAFYYDNVGSFRVRVTVTD